MELAQFQDKDEGTIQQAYKMDNEIQAIKDNLERGVKEMKGVALGLCQWKDKHLWYQGKVWIPNDKDSRRALYAHATTTPSQDMGEQQKLPNWSADNTSGQGCEKQSKDMSRTVTCVNGAKWSDMHHQECFNQTRSQTSHGNQ